jgi:hypothetical protein
VLTLLPRQDDGLVAGVQGRGKESVHALRGDARRRPCGGYLPAASGTAVPTFAGQTS